MHIAWLIPETLGGMAMPYIDWQRRQRACGLRDFDDDLPLLHDAGVRAIASMLGNHPDERIFRNAGFEFLCLSVPDGCAPTIDQGREFVAFVEKCREANMPAVVHCAAGLGRTGTMMAAYLIARGAGVNEAIREVRRVRPGAIETFRQEHFLSMFAGEFRG